MTRLLLTTLALTLGIAVAACGGTPARDPASSGAGTPGGAAGAAATVGTAVVTPTVVARLPKPTATPDPLSPVTSTSLADIVVPLAAEVVRNTAADETTDAQVDYVIAGTDEDALRAWFREQLPKHGWVEDEERDGAVIFLHAKQLSARYADEGLKRTATLFLGTVEDVPAGSTGFTLVVEAPAKE